VIKRLVNSSVDGFVQVSLNIEREFADCVTEIMESAGALSVSIASANEQECFDVATPGEPEWDYQQLSALFPGSQPLDQLKTALSRHLHRPADLEIEIVDDRDWERSWLDSLKPIRVGKGIWVCPSWCKPVQEDEINLTIDPGQAFGTGTHETTRLCLEYLAGVDLGGKNVIDFGCGSGILGIAAVRLGATAAFGVDIDPKAVLTAVQNAKLNHVSNKFHGMSNERFQLEHGDLKADLVIANILQQTIISLSELLSKMVTVNGTLLLSGILEHQVGSVVQAFGSGIQFTQESKNGWVLLIGRSHTGNFVGVGTGDQ
jgi:ribosomal protein L11 methyltransferase